MLPHDRFHLFAVADVTLHETVIGALLDIGQVLQVAGIGQLVEINDPVIGIFGNEQPHHMAADESGSAGNQNMFHNSSLFLLARDTPSAAGRPAVPHASRVPAPPPVQSGPYRAPTRPAGARGRIIRRCDGGQIGRDVRLSEDLGGKAIPGGRPSAAGIMPSLHAPDTARHERQQRPRQIGRTGGTPPLVVHDPQRHARRPALQHGFQKIVAVFGIEPRRTHQSRIAAPAPDRFLAGQLRGSIHAERSGRLLLTPGMTLPFATEHIIGGHMHQPEVFVGRHISQCGSTQPVHAIGLGRFRLGPVNRRIGRAVDDAGSVMVPRHLAPRRFAADVGLRTVHKHEPPCRPCSRHGPQRLSELAVGSRHQNSLPPLHHRINTKIRRTGTGWPRRAPDGADPSPREPHRPPAPPSRWPASDHPRPRPPHRQAHRDCRTCTGRAPSRSARQSRGQNRAARTAGDDCRPSVPPPHTVRT